MALIDRADLEPLIERTEDERDAILDKLDMYGERHFLFNEEYYPDRLQILDDDVIIRCCDSLSKKIYDRVECEYAEWVEHQNGGVEDERKHRSFQEQYEHLYCDARMLPDEDDPYWE